MIVNGVLYVNGRRASSAPAALEELREGASQGFVWIGMKSPAEAELRQVAEVFQMHELAFEDIIHANQRPKVEDYGDDEFVTVKTLHYEEASSQIESGEIAIYLGHRFVLTIRHGDGADLAGVRSNLEADAAQLALGPYAVLHAVLDRVVDGYVSIAHSLEEDVAELEQQVFSNGNRTWAQELYFLKREVIEYRRAVDPMRLVVERILLDSKLRVPAEIRPFFRDILDHVAKASELAAGLDQLLAAAMNADIAQVQLRQNEDMRKISAYVALAAVPTMLAGIYGMNFRYMPELSQPWGYPAALALMGGVCLLLWRKFKHSGWL